MTDDWSPADPDSPRVIYDLSGWSFDHQAELAAQLAEAEVPHSWDGTDLVVPEANEAAADGVIADVEHRLGIESDDPDDETALRMASAEVVHDQVPLDEGRMVTEYELDEWDDAELAAVTRSLLVQRRSTRSPDRAAAGPRWRSSTPRAVTERSSSSFRSSAAPHQRMRHTRPFR